MLAYFVTLIARRRERIFGEVVNGEMSANLAGHILWDIWKTLSVRYQNIELDMAIVMPDHFHGIIWIKGGVVGAIHESPQQQEPGILPQDEQGARILRRRRMLLPMAIGYLKMNTAKKINLWRGTPGVSVWQRDYFEHIIRDEAELHIIREYVLDNPARWTESGR